MICSSCNNESGRIIWRGGKERCHNCGDFAESGGVHTGGILSRNRHSIRYESVQLEGDTIHPYSYDKVSRKTVLNPDFVKLYPGKVKDWASTDQMVEDGYEKLVGISDTLNMQEAALHAETQSEIEEVGSSEVAFAKAVEGDLIIKE